jgi:hypothetical protein
LIGKKVREDEIEKNQFKKLFKINQIVIKRINIKLERCKN